MQLVENCFSHRPRKISNGKTWNGVLRNVLGYMFIYRSAAMDNIKLQIS